MQETAGLTSMDLENPNSFYYYLHIKIICKWCLNALFFPLQKEEECWCVLLKLCAVNVNWSVEIGWEQRSNTEVIVKLQVVIHTHSKKLLWTTTLDEAFSFVQALSCCSCLPALGNTPRKSVVNSLSLNGNKNPHSWAVPAWAFLFWSS